MAYPSTPRDAQNIPIGSVYVPGIGFVALQGATPINTDVNGNLSATVAVSGSVTATVASNGSNGAAAPSSSTQIGASDGTNLQPLLVESSSNKNLRTGIYSGANEMAVDASGNASVKLGVALPAGSNTIGNVGLVAGSAVVGGVELVDAAGTNKAAISAAGAIKVDNSGVTQPVSGTVTANSGVSATSTLSNVPAVTASTSILASNSSRKAMYLYNDSSSAMYLKFGTTASTTSFTVKVPAANFFEMPTVPIYTGALTAVWDTATGNARITELS